MKKFILFFLVMIGSFLYISNSDAGCIVCSQSEKNDGYCVPDVNGNYECCCDNPGGGSVSSCLTGATHTIECEQFGW